MIGFKQTAMVILLAVGIGFTVASGASLYDRGNGLIYDDVLDITWMQDANYAKTSGYSSDGRLLFLSGAELWAKNLTYGGFDDWRLPVIDVLNNSFSYSGTDWGFNGTTHNNELAYLWYVTLRNTPAFSTTGNAQTSIINTGPFINIVHNYYFLSDLNGIIYPAKSGWVFDMGSGGEGLGSGGLGYAIAVRDGDVTDVPEPSPLILFFMSFVFLIFPINKYKIFALRH